MIILTIRSDKPEAEVGLYKDYKKIDYIKWIGHRELTITLNTKINEILRVNNTLIDDIQGIVVYKGPGSFTGLRIGIAVANALAYGLIIPVVGTTGDTWQKTGLDLLTNKKSQRFITPEYGGEVHITRPVK